MSNARAARRRAEKERAGKPLDQIQLQNPVSQHFGAFIVGNAAAHEQIALQSLAERAPRAIQRLERLNADRIDTTRIFRHALKLYGCTHMVEEGSAKGQHLVLCGAGPSLREHAAEWCPKGDQVWGCNSALTWLHDNGYKPTHGFTVDQTPHMVVEWRKAPPVEYLIASTVHPHLIELLQRKEGAYIRFFHNFVGLKGNPISWPDGRGGRHTAGYEDWLYITLYPPTVRAGSGLNSVNRAIDVALVMGFEKITVLGADCCLQIKCPPPKGAAPDSPEHQRWLREDTVMHADGGSAIAAGATSLTMGGLIDGRYWETKVDLVISAVWLVKAAKQLKGRLQLIGDTLPNALMDKGQDFLDRLPRMVDTSGNPIPINLSDDPVYAGV